MAIHLFFSNRLEALADRYAAMVDLENRVKENILEGPLTIVPNPNLMKWLQLTLAARRSVLMNVDFQYLEAGLWGLLERMDPRKERPEMLTGSHVKMCLLNALMGLPEDDEDLAPLKGYLLGPERNRGSGYAVRLWQLTERMARLFESYEFHRSDMIRRWLDPMYRPTGMERCQQRFYRMTRDARDRYAQGAGQRLLSLGEYADEVLGVRSQDAGPIGPSKFVHLFGLSQVSPFHLGLIGRLRDDYDFLIYSLNPCREFWEDIRTPQERRWVERRAVRKLRISDEERDLGEILEPEENELLALWGRPGREHIRLLCALTDYDFEACFSRPEAPSTVLQAVQHHILTLAADRDPADRLPQDRSLQIVACPGIYREVETVYNSILYNLEQDRGLQLSDIAVFVPDMTTYKPAIDSVFNRRPRRLPYNLVDSRADVESVYGQAVLGILDLARGRFSRKEVFDLILNPCFMERWQVCFDDAAVWAGWAEALNVFHSFDAAHRLERGYPAGDAFTWKQGLQRLRLSRVMADPEEGAAERGTKKGAGPFVGRVPFQDVHTSDVDLMERFSVAIERLYRGVATLSRLEASGGEWADVILRVCDELLAVPPGLRGEATVKRSLAEGLDVLRRTDWIGPTGSVPNGGRPFRLDIIREFVASCLGSIYGGYGDYLTDGVTLSALQPMRPIPFRVVYVMGMEEGAFPGRAETSSLDLRLTGRRIGDVTLPERNRYLFLEMLLSVTEKLYLSYVARDLQKDRVIQPCSLVNQLRRYVEREVLPEGECFRMAEIPLKGSSDRYVAPDAVNAVSDVMVNYSLADRIAGYREQGRSVDQDIAVAGPLKERFQGLFPSFAMTVGPRETETGAVERITVRQLRRFLEDPVSEYLNRHLGILEEDEAVEEMALKEDEPFYSEFPVDYELKMTPLTLLLDRLAAAPGGTIDPRAVVAITDEVYERLKWKGKTPEGAFAEVDRRVFSEEALGRAKVLEEILREMSTAGEGRTYRAFFLGEQAGGHLSPGNRLPLMRLDPLGLPVRTWDERGEGVHAHVEIHGQLPWIWQDRSGGWHVLILSGSGKRPGKHPDRYLLEPLLFYLCSLCTEEGGRILAGADVTFHVAYKEKAKSWTYHVETDAARTYLTGLTSDYLNRQRPLWLPFKTVASPALRPFLMDGYGIQEGDRESFYVDLREAFSEETSVLVRLADPLIPEDALDRARERFGIFFRHRINTHDDPPDP